MSMLFTFDVEQIRSACSAKWLQKPDKLPHVKGVGIDSREDLTHKGFLAIKGAKHDGHDHVAQSVERGAQLLIIESARAKSLKMPPGVAMMHVESTRAALGRIAHAYRQSLRGTKVIAITGSSGKTTTKRLIHGVLGTTYAGVSSPKSFNNDIGVPLTLLSAKSSDKFAVVEIGTNAPGEIADLARIAAPDIAVITMIGRSHLEGLGSIEGVAREKGSLLAALPAEDGVAIVNADYPLLRPHLRRVKFKFLFGESEEADLRLTGRGEVNGNWWFEVNGRARFEIALPGRHNALNALAAVAVGRRFGLDDQAIRAGLFSVKPEAMRMTPQVAGGMTFYNDAYNANPEAMIAALDTFAELAGGARRRIVVLGDMLELGEGSALLHREIGAHIARIDDRCGLDQVILIGGRMGEAAGAIRKQFDKDRLTHIATLNDRAIASVRKLIRAGDAVLVKASRGMELEKLIAAFESAPSPRKHKRSKVVA